MRLPPYLPREAREVAKKESRNGGQTRKSERNPRLLKDWPSVKLRGLLLCYNETKSLGGASRDSLLKERHFTSRLSCLSSRRET